MPALPVTIEFGGGAELLFDKKKIHDVALPEKEKECTCKVLLITNNRRYTQPTPEATFTLSGFPEHWPLRFWIRNLELIRMLMLFKLIHKPFFYLIMLHYFVYLNYSRILGDLLLWIKENLLRERPELFLQDDSVRPGILVLVNDTDWELLDTANYVIQPKDTILFISTLHGG